MPLPRKHNIDQLKKLRKKTKGDIGDLVYKDQKKRKYMNLQWSNNPIDRKVDTYENFIKRNKKSKITESLNLDEDAFIIWENYLMENEDFVKNNYEDRNVIINDILTKYEYKEGISEMVGDFLIYLDDYLDEELISMTTESVNNKGMGPGNNDFFRNNFKQKNSSRISTDIFKVGKYLQIGNTEGYIDSIDEDFVYITKLPGVGEIEKISYKDLMRKIKFSKINENSGLPSEFWTDTNEDEIIDDYYEDGDNNTNYVQTQTEEDVQTQTEEDVQIQTEEDVQTQTEEDDQIQIEEDDQIQPENDMIDYNNIDIWLDGTEDNPKGRFNYE